MSQELISVIVGAMRGTTIRRAILAAAVVAIGTTGVARASSTADGHQRGLVGTAAGIATADWRGEDDYDCPGGRPNPIRVCVASPFVLTVAAADPDNAYLNLCTWASWCTLGGSLWGTLTLGLDCTAVEGSTWYGGAWVAYDGKPAVWWAFKVVDGALSAPDRVGMNRPSPGTSSPSPPISDGACGARQVATAPVVAGDFRVVDAVPD